MGSTQSIPRTIQPIAVKFTQNVANIAILEAILKIRKMPINNYFMQKL